MWGDDVNADVIEAYVWRGALALAERLWSAPSALRDPRKNNAPQVRLAQMGCRMRMRGIAVGPTQADWCPADSLPLSPLGAEEGQEQREIVLLRQEVALLRRENAALRQSELALPLDGAGARVKTDDVSTRRVCPPELLLWNGLCRPAEGWGVSGWSRQKLLDRHVTIPRYLSAEHKPKAINISHGRKLFVDSFLIDANRSSNVQIAYHSAEYADATVNPVLAASEPWEMADASMGSGGYGGFASPFSGGTWYNPVEQRYEMYYRCGAGATCVAWSNDTLTWHKPLVRRRQASKGLLSNIMVEARYDGATVWLDQDTKNASRRYVLASGGSRYDIYTSANGLDFKNESSSGPIQDRSSVFKNALTNTWVFSI